MVDLYGATSLKETESPLPEAFHFHSSSIRGREFRILLPLHAGMLIGLIWCSLVQAAITAGSKWVWWSCQVQRHSLCSSPISGSYSLSVPLLVPSRGERLQCTCSIYGLALHSGPSSSLWLWFSAWTTVHHVKKLLWWGLRKSYFFLRWSLIKCRRSWLVGDSSISSNSQSGFLKMWLFCFKKMTSIVALEEESVWRTIL